MSRRKQSSPTQKALLALREAVARPLEEHRRRGIPVAVWRNGRAISIPAAQAGALHEPPVPYRTRPHGKES